MQSGLDLQVRIAFVWDPVKALRADPLAALTIVRRCPEQSDNLLQLFRLPVGCAGTMLA